MQFNLFYGLLEIAVYPTWSGVCWKDKYCFTSVNGYEILED